MFVNGPSLCLIVAVSTLSYEDPKQHEHDALPPEGRSNGPQPRSLQPRGQCGTVVATHRNSGPHAE